MAKKSKGLYAKVAHCLVSQNNIGRNPSKAKMNKHLSEKISKNTGARENKG